MYLEVGVFEIERQLESFALNRARKGCRNIQIQSIAKFVALRGAAGLNSGGQIASVVPPKA